MKKILVLCMVLLLAGCDSNSMDGSLFSKSSNDYIENGEVENDEELDEEIVLEYFMFSALNDYSEILIQDGSYMVYYYSETCGACASFKETMLTFADEDTSEYDFYLMHAPDLTGERSSVVLGDGGLTGTPTLMIIENGVIVEYYLGTLEIGDYLTSMTGSTE